MEDSVLEQIEVCHALIDIAGTPSMKANAIQILEYVYKLRDTDYKMHFAKHKHIDIVDPATVLESICFLQRLIELSLVRMLFLHSESGDMTLAKRSVSYMDYILNIYSPPEQNSGNGNIYVYIVLTLFYIVGICMLGYGIIAFGVAVYEMATADAVADVIGGQIAKVANGEIAGIVRIEESKSFSEASSLDAEFTEMQRMNAEHALNRTRYLEYMDLETCKHSFETWRFETYPNEINYADQPWTAGSKYYEVGGRFDKYNKY